MEFVDRKAELKVLKEAYSAKSGALVAIYGRRRIGKTELITRFTNAIRGAVYYMATSESDLKQLKDLSSLVGIKLGDEELARFGAVDWEALFSRIKSLSAKQRVVIAIDEFPYLTKSNRAISSVFQKGWDLYLKDADAMLILSGSSISMMHSEVLDYSAPLFQRSTSILELKQLGIDYALSLNPRMKFEDRMQAYFIFGGVAAYYSYTEGSNGIKELLRNIFKPGSVFLDEPSTILSEETKKEARYIDILDMIANGVTKTNEIATKMGVQPSNIGRYLDVLDRTGMAAKVFPVTEEPNPRSRKGIYRIRDNYLRFWFTFVKRNRELIATKGAESAAGKVLSELDAFCGAAFEDFAAEFIRLNPKGRFPQFSNVGKWWGRDRSRPKSADQEEIDVVALEETTRDILFAECKWSASMADIGVLNDLRRRAGLVQWNSGNRKEHFAIFSKSGFTEAIRREAAKSGTMLFDLASIEEALNRITGRAANE